MYRISTVLRAWRELDPDRTHGSGALYLRKHWFEIRVDDGSVMKIYFSTPAHVGPVGEGALVALSQIPQIRVTTDFWPVRAKR